MDHGTGSPVKKYISGILLQGLSLQSADSQVRKEDIEVRGHSIPKWNRQGTQSCTGSSASPLLILCRASHLRQLEDGFNKRDAPLSQLVVNCSTGSKLTAYDMCCRNNCVLWMILKAAQVPVS